MAHGDYTGQTKARLAQQHAEEAALAARSMSMVSEVVRENNEAPISLMTEKDEENLHITRQYNPETDNEDVIEVDTPEPQFLPVKFRASEDLEDITVGQDRHFTLLAGRNYIAPRWVAEHLDRQGLIWH